MSSRTQLTLEELLTLDGSLLKMVPGGVGETFRNDNSSNRPRPNCTVSVGFNNLVSNLKMKPYQSKFLQTLHEDDSNLSLDLCKSFLVQHESHLEFWRNILWPDVASFKLHSRVNRHTCVYRASRVKSSYDIPTEELNFVVLFLFTILGR